MAIFFGSIWAILCYIYFTILDRSEDVDGEEDRIVGGSESRVNEFPFVVALSLNGRTQFCGASLISEKVQSYSDRVTNRLHIVTVLVECTYLQRI